MIDKKVDKNKNNELAIINILIESRKSFCKMFSIEQDQLIAANINNWSKYSWMLDKGHLSVVESLGDLPKVYRIHQGDTIHQGDVQVYRTDFFTLVFLDSEITIEKVEGIGEVEYSEPFEVECMILDNTKELGSD